MEEEGGKEERQVAGKWFSSSLYEMFTISSGVIFLVVFRVGKLYLYPHHFCTAS